MTARIATHLRANLLGYVALFVALGGISYASGKLPKNSVGTKQLKTGAVTQAKLDPALAPLFTKPGVQGPVGPTGAPGEAGAAGAPGATGPAGVAGVTADPRGLRTILLTQGAPPTSTWTATQTPVSGLTAAGTAASTTFTADTASDLLLSGVVGVTLTCPAGSPTPCEISGVGAYLDGNGIQASQRPLPFPQSVNAGSPIAFDFNITSEAAAAVAPGAHTLAVGFTQTAGTPMTGAGSTLVDLRALLGAEA
jgi:hypothetical protein